MHDLIDEPGFAIWETYPLEIIFEDENGEPDPHALEDWRAIVVTIEQAGCKPLEFTEADMAIDPEAAAISIPMSQQQTALFKPGTASLMVNVLYTDSERDVSTTARLVVRDNYHRKAMR